MLLFYQRCYRLQEEIIAREKDLRTQGWRAGDLVLRIMGPAIHQVRQAPVRKDEVYRRDLIVADKAKQRFIVSHPLSLT
jgi:hypothetical protein